MKIAILFLILMVTACAKAPLPGQVQQTSAYCATADETIHLSRCETGEAICMVSPGGQTCWLKQSQPAPSPAPSVSPVTSPSPAPSVKK